MMHKVSPQSKNDDMEIEPQHESPKNEFTKSNNENDYNSQIFFNQLFDIFISNASKFMLQMKKNGFQFRDNFILFNTNDSIKEIITFVHQEFMKLKTNYNLRMSLRKKGQLVHGDYFFRYKGMEGISENMIQLIVDVLDKLLFTMFPFGNVSSSNLTNNPLDKYYLMINDLRSFFYHLLANERFDNKNYSTSISNIHLAILLNPSNDALLYYDRADYYITQSDFKKAKENCDISIQIEPEFPHSYTSRSMCFEHEKEYESGLRDCRKAISIDPFYPEAYLDTGYLLHQMKRYEESLEYYGKSIKLDPNFGFAYNTRGWTKNELKQYKDAIKDFDMAISLNPKHVNAYNNRAWSYYELKEYEAAINDFNIVISLDPNYVAGYNGRGLAFESLHRYTEAYRDHSKCIELKPNHVHFHNRGWLNYTTQNHEESISDFTRSIELQKDFVNAYSGRAMVYQSKSNFVEAIKDLNEAIKLNSQNASLFLNRGWCYYHTKSFQLAVDDFTKSIQLKPSVSAYNKRGLAYNRINKHSEALKDYDYCISIEPLTHVFLYNRGWTFYMMKRFDRAQMDFDRCLTISPQHYINYEILLDCKTRLFNDKYFEFIDNNTLINNISTSRRSEKKKTTSIGTSTDE